MLCSKSNSECWGEVTIADFIPGARVRFCEGHAGTPIPPARAAVNRLIWAARAFERSPTAWRDLLTARDEVFQLLGLITEKGRQLADPLEVEE